MSRQDDPLLREAQATDYGLRSTFFYRKLHELGFSNFGSQIEALIGTGQSYRWEERAQWQVSDSAWEQALAAGIEPLRVFAHPLVCTLNPRLLAYYRSIAVISQKGTALLASATSAYEDGTRTTLPPDRALAMCRLFNQHISAILDSTLTFSRSDLDALLLASAGAQIDGSWRNAIGQEAESVVRRVIVRGLVKDGSLSTYIDETGHSRRLVGADEDTLARLDTFRGFSLTNGSGIRFSSEPDVSLLAKNGQLVVAVEVKGGKDKAGALERFGAAQKSFSHVKRQNPAVHTIYVANCITPEVERRLEEARRKDGMFHDVVLLSDLLAGEDARTAFVAGLVVIFDKK